MKTRPLILLAIMATAAILPSVNAVPTVLPVSSATVFVDGATDYFEFSSFNQVGATWTITAPSGQQATVTLAGSGGGVAQRWSLSGTRIAGTGAWDWSGDLDNAPADGTWTIQVQGLTYQSYDSAMGGGAPGPTLSVQGRTIHWGVNVLNPAQRAQIWNWHQTVGTWDEPSTVPTALATASDPIAEAPEEDPNNARFFNDAGVSSFTAYTLNHGTPTDCTGTPDMTVNGAWIGATGTTFTRFIYRDGDFTGTTDLRTIPFSQTTTPENEGSSGSGTDAKTISYNNAAGTSYQFIANDTTGETLGTVIYARTGLCGTPAFDTASDVEHNTDALQVTVSHSQCRDDPVTFAVIMQDNPSGLQEHLLQLYVFDANQGGFGSPPDPVEVLYFNTTTMHRTAASSEAHSHYVAEVLAPGNYVAYAYVDYTGIGAIDYVSADAFSVPSGSCSDLAADLTPVFTAIESSRVNLTDYLDHIDYLLHQIDANLTVTRGDILDAIENLNVTIIGNVTGNFSIDNATLTNIYGILIEKLGPPGEPVTIDSPWMILLFGLAVLALGVIPNPRNYGAMAFGAIFIAMGSWIPEIHWAISLSITVFCVYPIVLWMIENKDKDGSGNNE